MYATVEKQKNLKFKKCFETILSIGVIKTNPSSNLNLFEK